MRHENSWWSHESILNASKKIAKCSLVWKKPFIWACLGILIVIRFLWMQEIESLPHQSAIRKLLLLRLFHQQQNALLCTRFGIGCFQVSFLILFKIFSRNNKMFRCGIQIAEGLANQSWILSRTWLCVPGFGSRPTNHPLAPLFSLDSCGASGFSYWNPLCARCQITIITAEGGPGTQHTACRDKELNEINTKMEEESLPQNILEVSSLLTIGEDNKLEHWE